MPQLLLELFSEEIPARMQAGAARDLERMMSERLTAAGFVAKLSVFAGPRRLTLVAENLPAAQPDRDEEVKGPRVGAPPQAMEGFLRKTGLAQGDLIERDGVYFGQISSKGRPTTEIIVLAVDEIVRSFPWPKSMKWGTGTLRWVRPLKRIICLFDGHVVELSIDGIAAGSGSEGHRFMGSGQPFRVTDFDEYKAALAKHYVVLDAAERKQRILDGARLACAAKGLELVEDEGLLDEVAGLAEWPTPILGDMDPSFLDLPPEVIRTSMRTHQKYFAVRDPKTGGLAPHFVVVANIEASDDGKALAAGNAKVLSARLSDARFFWDEDRKVGFEPWLEKLNGVTYHAKLGTMAERVDRISALAAALSPLCGADRAKTAEAARLAKGDLASGMVGEFPELQGVMGAYYARAAGIDADIAEAIRDHYRPQGPNDAVPTAPISIAVALAEKFDSLVGFFSIDEKPTGSKDPYALRRAALGVIRILLANRVHLPLRQMLKGAPFTDSLVDFFADRLKVTLRDQGKRHDLVDAVFALGDDDLVRIVDRVEALDAFLAAEDGANLLAGYKRAANILRAEEKKGALPTGHAAALAGAPAEEGALIAALSDASPKVDAALKAEDFAAAMTALAALRRPVDAFFDKVLVNSDNAAERDNRLRLLGNVKALMERVADFSLVSG